MSVSLISGISGLFDCEFLLKCAIKRGTFLCEDDCNDHTIDPKDTCHNHWNDGFHYDFRLENTHAADSDPTLCGPVGSSEV